MLLAIAIASHRSPPSTCPRPLTPDAGYPLFPPVYRLLSAVYRPALSCNLCILGPKTRQILVDPRAMDAFSCKNLFFRQTFCHRVLFFHTHSQIDLHF